jgi:hypothetical protein
MRCDKEGCTNEATMMGQGFEFSKEVSARCGDHGWTHEEKGLLLASSARTRTAWDSLTEVERAFVLQTESSNRTQVFQALLNKKES